MRVISFFCLLILLCGIVYAAEEASFGPPLNKEGYDISRSKVERQLKKGDILRDSFSVTNNMNAPLRISVSSTDSLSGIISFDIAGITFPEKNKTEVDFSVIGREIGSYSGEIILSGDITEKIPVNVSVFNESSGTDFLIALSMDKNEISIGNDVKLIVQITDVKNKNLQNVSFDYILQDPRTNTSESLLSETADISGSIELRKTFHSEKFANEGNFIIKVSSAYKDINITSSQEFEVVTPFLYKKLFGYLPIWVLIIIVFVLISGLIAFISISRWLASKKKYKMQLDYKTLAKKTERTLCFGKIAETNVISYYDMDNLTTHAVVAGATGGGKSIAAQVIIEEALLKNTAVVVFDPTAQWSGMLRKCEDKKMLSFYPNFGLKPTDAKAFPGNVRFVTNYKELLDLPKYVHPGQIQIFALNKLAPQEIDLFVANTIASIFKAGPDEYAGLRVLFVFDEVHRLLPKFGGSGKGFLQIERACREFRKWGYGVMLVSQVLSDFVGEIKANINTELQMRTRDEADLNRLKTKFGEEFLQSLIKASVGVGMLVNPAYNRGKPYFVNFRPILHNTRRLSDAELEKYNHYNEVIDDLEFQIEQFEQEKVDVFDLKMELKLIRDKLMTGSFSVVDIYLEGLLPRIDKQWQTLGKKPKKREIKTVDESLIQASLAEAQKARDEWDKKTAPSAGKPETENKGDIKLKIVRPLTFENGIMVSSFKELTEVLPSLQPDVFAAAVNGKKNDISDWISKEIDPAFGKAMNDVRTKKDIINYLQTFGMEKKVDKAIDPQNKEKTKEKLTK